MSGHAPHQSRARAAALGASGRRFTSGAGGAPVIQRDDGGVREAGPSSGSLLILIVDDNETNLVLMKRVLQALGHTPLTAKTAKEGLEVAFRERPDLVFLDIVLPGLDGHQVMRLMKTAPDLAGMPIVAVTALTTPGHPTRALAEGFDGYLQKPIELERVRELIAELRRV